MPVAHKTGIAGLHSHNFCMTSSLRHTWISCSTNGLRPRRCSSVRAFSDHSRDLDAVLDTSERIAREKYAPFNRLVDLEEPRTRNQARWHAAGVVLPQYL